MNRQLLSAAGLLLASLAVPVLAADECIKAPSRTKACPNLAYKVLSASADANAGKGMICICLLDFQHLKEEPEDQAANILWQREIRTITSRYQITKQQFIELLR